MKILGLDLGTNSLGWALVDDEKKHLIDTGVRIFPEGVDRDKGKEKSKNENRRNARMARRLIFRRKIRKKMLVKVLKENNFYPENNDLIGWFKLNPYELRAKAVNEQITLVELGRIFYQMAQRRGFKSSRKSGSTSEESAIYKGDAKNEKIGIADTKKAIENKTLGEHLYEISYKPGEKYSEKERVRNRYTLRKMYEQEFDAIWDKQTLYYPEILTTELRHTIGYKKADENSAQKNGILFFQRLLRSQKDLIGKCPFEPNKTKCPISAIPFELFRTHQFLNTVSYGENNEKFTQNQKEILINELFNRKEKFEFKEIKKKLKLSEAKFNYEDKHKVVGNKTISNLSKIFTPKIWDKKSVEDQEKIWHIFYDAKDDVWLKKYAKNKWNFSDKQSEATTKIRFKQDYANLSKKAINNILIFLQKGYVYSDAVLLGGVYNAIGAKKWKELSDDDKKLIEDNVISINSDDTNKEGQALNKIKEFLISEKLTTQKRLKKLYHHSQMDTIKEQKLADKLPSLAKLKAGKELTLRNPIVEKSLIELRKVVNAIIERYGKPDMIKIEMARELKMPASKRQEILRKNWEKERENDEAKKILDDYGLTHSRANIHKYLLWKEAKETCPYTGQKIALNELFNDNIVQIEHIVPYSKSLDDSFRNKTICESKENQTKGNKTPYDFYANNPQKWEEVKQRAYKLLPYPKYKHFIAKKHDNIDDFASRQLNDTRYISKEAKKYLTQICRKDKIMVASGGVTAELRHFWGLNGILNNKIKVESCTNGEYWVVLGENDKVISKEKWTFEGSKNNKAPKELAKKGKLLHGYVHDGYFIPQKDRSDHRHHAIDAIVIACLEHKYINEISRCRKKNKDNFSEKFPMPWTNFFNDVKTKIETILTSYYQEDRVTTKITKTIKKNGKTHKTTGLSARGQLHEETVYGKHKDQQGKYAFYVRKPIESLTAAAIDKIADPEIKRIIKNKLGLRIDEKVKSIPKDFFYKIEGDKKIPQIYLPNNKGGDPVPVKKVRIKENLSNALPLKETTNIKQYINPGNNRHVIIYFENKTQKQSSRMVTFMEAVKRTQQGLPMVEKDMSDANYIMHLKKRDMVLFNFDADTIDFENTPQEELFKNLYTVRKMTEVQLVFTLHNSANINADRAKFPHVIRKSPNSLKCIKVYIDPLGKIKRHLNP